jgi:hypothetical protein
MTGHPPSPMGATGRETQLIHRLHQAATRAEEPGLRSLLSDAMGMIVELVKQRGMRRDLDEHWDRPHDED